MVSSPSESGEAADDIVEMALDQRVQAIRSAIAAEEAPERLLDLARKLEAAILSQTRQRNPN